MRLGYFGGTFDPVHLSHAALTDLARRQLRLDRVLVMPAGNPYHKAAAGVSSMTYRYRMCELAFAGQADTEISQIEVRRLKPSFTYETIAQIKAGLDTGDQIYLLCGSDILKDLTRWYDVAELLKLVTLAIAPRRGTDPSQAESAARRLQQTLGLRYVFLGQALAEDASHDIRARIARHDDSAWASLNPKVAAFIQKHQLYQKEKILDTVSPAVRNRLPEYEAKLYNYIHVPRIIHSLDTMFYALQLASRFGVNPDQTAVAALLHDFAKEQTPRLRQEWSLPIPAEMQHSEAAWHGPVAARLLAKLFNIHDQAIELAICYHTVLRAGASPLEKVIYLADKLEPGRTYGDLAPLRQLAETNLDQAVAACLKAVEHHLAVDGQTLNPLSAAALREITDQSTK
ncbi:MAG: nicotinate (nicotinamide) nucleotide adenylyltransferase [Oscillospiraceae bacterium]|nr:nicotinate (nicotinamide) nucleotide adenylyltransferase [Oscillospiraceae bacterium]MDD4367442.1 nicotinate (nicotinamide) nucleotide adenylyltransferase [Oscillospiraceae bacterium]